VGTAGEPEDDSVFVEYNRLLVEDSFRPQFGRKIIEYVDRDTTWDQFQLDGFVEDEAASLLQGMPGADIRLRTSPFFDLQSVREKNEDVITKLGRNTRANIRRQLRDYGELHVEWAETLTQADEFFSELVALHQDRWTSVGKPGVFASRRFHDFQLELLARGLADRVVELFRVRDARQTIGSLFMLVDRNRLLGYISGFAPFESGTSPGLVSHYLCMQDALHRGYDAYDFLVGEHQHKQSLSNAENQLVWATWRRNRLKFRVADAARFIKRKMIRR
jgi:CelD/BcsL family acetyltransferase involved in cellulose biosynthesis